MLFRSVEPGEKVVHVIPQDYSVDNEMNEKNPVGMLGDRLEGFFHVIVGRMSSIGNIEKCIHRAGLKLAGVILESLASSHAVLTEEEREAGVVLVDIGGGTSDLAIFQDGLIRHSAVIPFGGNIITNDIKEGCALLQKQAESIKQKFGSALGNMAKEDMVISIPGMQGWESKEISCKNLACIIQARMEEIIDFVAHHISASGYYEKLGAGIVITGGGALLKNITQLMKLKTGLDVRMGRPNNYFINDIVPFDEMPHYSTAVGLMISSSIYVTPKMVEQTIFQNEPLKDTSKIEAKPKDRKEQPFIKKKKIKEEVEYRTGDLFGSFNFGNIKKTIAGMFDEKDTEM